MDDKWLEDHICKWVFYNKVICKPPFSKICCKDSSLQTVPTCDTNQWMNKVGYLVIIEPRSEKTGLRGFRPGPIQTRLYSHRRWLEA